MGCCSWVFYGADQMLKGRNISSFVSPANIINLTEFQSNAWGTPPRNLYYGDWGYATTNFLPNGQFNINNVLIRHLGGTNYLYNDGHVKFQRPDSINFGPGTGGKTSYFQIQY